LESFTLGAPVRRFFPFLVLSALSASGLACSGDTSGPPDGEETGFSGRDGQYTVSVFESGARGRVYFTVYLPPGWTPEGSRTYPLIFFLHGQSGDEHRFSDNVPVSELNQWINQSLAPPFVLVAPRGADEIGTVQWFYPENVTLLTSEAANEFRAFCWRTFRAGGSSDKISVQGQSRGASGAIFFALNHWDKFASAVANAFVSDYVLDDYRAAATQNRNQVIESGILLRMTIGTEDFYVTEKGRIGSPALHEHLDTLGIPHEYEVLPGVTHGFWSLWHYQRSDGLQTGLYEILFHARAWSGAG